MNTTHLQHLYWRGGFSLPPSEIEHLSSFSRQENVKRLFKHSEKYTPLFLEEKPDFNSLKNYRMMNATEKQELQKKNRQLIAKYNITWFNHIKSSEQALRERMTLFWANHFVCRGQHYYHIQLFNNILRKNALGNFKTFVHEVSKSASMLKYLNAKQNNKQSPNENFARELMELFTLGIGNYSEKDIQEAARAFTGWNHDLKGDFVLRKRQHDYGIKTFFGKTGNFEGEDIIDIILEEEQCARFICEKMYRYFVSTQINQKHVEELVSVFYPSYDISAVMEHMLLSEWFYDEKVIGTKIKSPMDLIIGIDKTVPIEFEKDRQLLYLQKQLGQQLLYPPNVAGWEGGQTWIDTNSLMLRLKLPAILLNNAVISLQGIPEFEDTYEQYLEKRKGQKSVIKITSDWYAFQQHFEKLKAEDIQHNLIVAKMSPQARHLLAEISVEDKKGYCLQVMSLPEYQLC